MGEAQRVFDTVAGPNLRLRDNLIQLACVAVGAAAGFVTFGVIGVVAGMLVALIVSGLVIGILRWRGARK